ncbi:MAG: N-(5'-phosphoribosyl)anthranilate isomerase, partial [Pyrobaculum sp.]
MVLVKICGVARLEDAEALDGVVEYIGFIIEPTSPRSVRPQALKALRSAVARSRPVFVTASIPPRQAVDMAAESEIPVVQHHGALRPDDFDYAKSRGVAIAPVAVYKPGVELKQLVEELLKTPHEYVLVDADKKSQERYEGGLKIPLTLLAEVAPLGRVALAGGITPENAQLIARLNPYMIDVASGVEA